MSEEQYSSTDVERAVDEGRKTAIRTEFARDRARILHSVGLRRLAGKTQVMGLRNTDFPRTRLTHTLEVAQIAREIGTEVGADADLCDLAGLAHDLGHPPFGHNGEDALDEISQHIGGFEGNAQSFRVLTRLEAKTFTSEGQSAGLNLTRASLDAVIKYPTFKVPGKRKFNAYLEDGAMFDWVRAEVAEGTCIESQIMDWADDVAYSVHDVEDGVFTSNIVLGRLGQSCEQDRVVHACAQYWPEASETLLRAALVNILSILAPLVTYDHSPGAVAALKNITSELIGRFVTSAVTRTLDHYQWPLRRYRADLEIPHITRAEVTVLKAIACVYLFDSETEEKIGQRILLKELVKALHQVGVDSLDPYFVPAWWSCDDENAKLRVVLDQVASLTDTSAQMWHQRWCS